jgi:hypothetical protein
VKPGTTSRRSAGAALLRSSVRSSDSILSDCPVIRRHVFIHKLLVHKEIRHVIHEAWPPLDPVT